MGFSDDEDEVKREESDGEPLDDDSSDDDSNEDDEDFSDYYYGYDDDHYDDEDGDEVELEDPRGGILFGAPARSYYNGDKGGKGRGGYWLVVDEEELKELKRKRKKRRMERDAKEIEEACRELCWKNRPTPLPLSPPRKKRIPKPTKGLTVRSDMPTSGKITPGPNFIGGWECGERKRKRG